MKVIVFGIVSKLHLNMSASDVLFLPKEKSLNDYVFITLEILDLTTLEMKHTTRTEKVCTSNKENTYNKAFPQFSLLQQWRHINTENKMTFNIL